MPDRTAATALRLLGPRAVLSGTGNSDSLQNVNTACLPSGSLCLVQENQTLYRLDKSASDPVDPPAIIAPASGLGRWIALAGAAVPEPPTPFTPTIASFTFKTPGSHASLTGDNGEIISIVRNSTARYELNGQEVIAGVNEARVDEDGLIIEPACTQLLLDPDNLLAASWLQSPNATITANEPDPLGGTTAFLQTAHVDGGSVTHYLLQVHAIAGVTSTISCNLGFNATCRYYSLGDNSGAHVAYYDGQLGVVVSVTGAGARAEMQYLGFKNGRRWYRCSITCVPSAGLTFLGAPSTNGTTQTFQGTGVESVALWRPQTEANEFATSWCLVSRAADTILTTIPNPLYEWCFEIEAVPCGPQKGKNLGGAAMGWFRGTHMPLFGLNTYTGGNSIEGYVNGGAPVTSVYDSVPAEKHDTGTGLNSGNYYVGWRRLAFTSNGTQRPSVFIDSIECTPTVAGAGTGQYKGLPFSVLHFGATSTGVVGGFKIRSLVLSNTYVPQTTPSQALQYAWAFDRGYVTNANCVACLGDSNTMGNVAFATLTPWPQVILNASTTKQMHNYGVGSNSSLQALERLRTDVIDKAYGELVVFIGINDTNALLPAQTTIDNIATIAAEALLDGSAKVILCTLMPDGRAPTDPSRIALNTVNAAIAAMCAADPTRLILADIYALVDDPGNPGTMLPAYDIDGGSLHLNQTGQNAVAVYIQSLL